MDPMPELLNLLQASAARHTQLCPRQVLGVRMGLYGGAQLGLDLPRADKRLLVVVETDGCALDGIAVATGCSPGRRTLRIEDFGKVAATFVDAETGRAVRVTPHAGARIRAYEFAPGVSSRWQAQLVGYQRMPDALLLSHEWVELRRPLETIIGRPGIRAACEMCGEEIINGRELVHEGSVLCRACAGSSYYRSVEPSARVVGAPEM